MSLANLVSSGSVFEDVDPGYISDSAMEQLVGAIAYESLNPEEYDQYVSESVGVEIVTEAQKNIVRLNKDAIMNRAYKTAILQCAAEANDKDYKKIRTLWKLEAKLFRKMEQRYKSKAMSRARVAVKELKKKKSTMAKTAGARATTGKGGAQTQLKGASSLLKSGPVKLNK